MSQEQKAIPVEPCGAREPCPARGIDDVCELPKGHDGRHVQTRIYDGQGGVGTLQCTWPNEASR